jgi:hypothetical protein
VAALCARRLTADVTVSAAVSGRLLLACQGASGILVGLGPAGCDPRAAAAAMRALERQWQSSTSAGTAVKRTRPENGHCTWGDVGNYLEEAIASAAPFIGRPIAAHYWRQELQRTSQLPGFVYITVRGTVETSMPHLEVTDEAGRELEEVRAAWLERCARIIPALDELAGSLQHVPWLPPPAAPGRPS